MEIIDGKLHATAEELNEIASEDIRHPLVSEVLRAAGIEAMDLNIQVPEIETAARHKLILEVPEDITAVNPVGNGRSLTLEQLDRAVRQSPSSAIEVMY